MDISLVICTRNRANRLDPCLAHVAALRLAGDWELVLVDNGSTDHTADVVRQFARDQAGRLRVRVVQQPLKGLSNARNAGMASAAGRILAFTDDDCYVAPDYLEAVAAAFTDPRLGYASGRVLLHDPTDAPATISLSTEPQDFAPRSYVVPGVIKGANMAFRREALWQIFGFDPVFGSGARFPAEDCDAAARASLAGWWGRYEPAMVVSHHHGRKAGDLAGLYRDYDLGRGAYHAKLLLKGSAGLAWRGWRGLPRRALWRPATAFWEARGALAYVSHWLRQAGRS